MMESTVGGSESGDITVGQAFVFYLCFFVSGIAGLVYEVLWAKYLSLYVGSTGLAQVIVLATFMGGMALGSQVLGVVADRVRHPLKMYAFLELGIGVYALLFDMVFRMGRGVFLSLARMGDLNEGHLVVAKIVACVMSILLPTFLMGGTLPAMGRYMMRTLRVVGPRVSRLYFLNSLGAAFGCLLAGFFLIRQFGLQFSMVIGATLNILVGLAALAMQARGPEEESAAMPSTPESEPGEDRIPRWAVGVIFVGVGLSGAISMMYEVSWIRLLTLVLGSSTYSFSLMLAAFILGLSIGSFLLSLRRKPGGYVAIMAWSEVGVGLTVLLSLPFYVKLPFWFNQISSSLTREPATFGVYQFLTFALCMLVMIVPTVLQGITLPAAIKILVPDIGHLGRRIGYAYAVNTIGTLIGSVGAGFIGLPLLGIKGTLELAVGLNCLLGLSIMPADRRPRVRAWGVIGAVALMAAVWVWYALAMGSWDKQVLSAGVYRSRQRIPTYASLLERVSQRTTLFYRDGIDATIAVQDVAHTVPERLLVINGKVDASTEGDMPTQKLMAYLPLLLHPRPERVLIVGVGSGATIGSVLAFPQVKRVDVVELSRDVIEASRLFEAVNGRFWTDPRVRVWWEDAKTFLQITEETYDVIISEPTNPWIAGIAGVFSHEYFESCRDRLAPGGFFVQWIQAYELENTTFYLILETFSKTFPCYSLWNTAQSDTVLLGAPHPYRPDYRRMEARLKESTVQSDMKWIGLTSLTGILSLQMEDKADRPSHVRWFGAMHSDYFPILEYVAPRGFFIGAKAEGVKWLDQRSQSPRNARLWIEDYLKSHAPTVDELRECFGFAARHPGLFSGSAALWARAWEKADPDNPNARMARAELTGPNHHEALAYLREAGAPPATEADWASEKLECRLAMEDYLAGRNWMEAGSASALLERMEAILLARPEMQDADLFGWRGHLLYDLGHYEKAAESLIRYLQAEQKLDPRIEAALLACEAWLKLGKPDRALSVYNAYLSDYADDVRVWLMKARLSHDA